MWSGTSRKRACYTVWMIARPRRMPCGLRSFDHRPQRAFLTSLGYHRFLSTSRAAHMTCVGGDAHFVGRGKIRSPPPEAQRLWRISGEPGHPVPSSAALSLQMPEPHRAGRVQCSCIWLATHPASRFG